MEPVVIQTTKTLAAFLKKRRYLEKKKFLVNICDLMPTFISSELKPCTANTFPKRLFSILSIYLHHLITLVNSHAIIFYVYCAINHIPRILLKHFHIWLKVNLAKGQFKRIKLQWECVEASHISGFLPCGDFTVNEFIKNVLKILETVTRYKQTNTVNYASTMNRIKSY